MAAVSGIRRQLSKLSFSAKKRFLAAIALIVAYELVYPTVEAATAAVGQQQGTNTSFTSMFATRFDTQLKATLGDAFGVGEVGVETLR